MSELARVPVGTAYDVVLGRGVLAGVADLVPDSARRVLIVHSDTLPQVVGPVRDALRAKGLHVVDGVVPDAEAAKTIDVAAGLWGLLGRESFTRTDVVVGVGGGTVTDLAGFVAAAWLRGVPVVNVPTTVLAMVDAAVGGKTGVNTAEGKNLVGAFYEPLGVLCDIDVLATLPEADFAAGMAEVIKAGFIADPVILELAEANPGSLRRVGPATVELIERAIAMKASVVTQDLREAGLREILNYGHTLGHAIEQHTAYTMRHGEAVAIGMVFAAELAHRSGLIDDALLARHRSALALAGLPTAYDGAGLDKLLAAMGRDKKTRGSTLRFVVLEGLARPTRFVGPSEGLLRAAYDALA
ncbi:MAG: 3-dehydroquinate synthase [Actinobacteria bacterium]|nr:3-dehydroquinate synthase [Actinomycetota bacterium]